MFFLITTLFTYTIGGINKYKCKQGANREELNLHIKLTPRRKIVINYIPQAMK